MCFFDEEERPPLTPLPIIRQESLEITRLRAELADIKEQRDEAQRMACWQYARRYGGGNPRIERSLAENYAKFGKWDCFKDYDWSKYE